MATTICATPSTSARVHLSPYPPPKENNSVTSVLFFFPEGIINNSSESWQKHDWVDQGDDPVSD